MWLTSVPPSICTLWLMANALVLPIHTLTHTYRWTHKPLCRRNAFCLNSHANSLVCVCVCMCEHEMLKHFSGYDLPLVWRQISVILEKYTHSPVISAPLISHWCGCVWGAENETMTRLETEQGREGQIERQRWRQQEQTKGWGSGSWGQTRETFCLSLCAKTRATNWW